MYHVAQLTQNGSFQSFPGWVDESAYVVRCIVSTTLVLKTEVDKAFWLIEAGWSEMTTLLLLNNDRNLNQVKV